MTTGMVIMVVFVAIMFGICIIFAAIELGNTIALMIDEK